jgi:hypothetical protein
MKKTQNQFVLDHLLDHGYMTDAIAQNYRIRRLAARIAELRAGIGSYSGRPLDIETELRTDEMGQRYAYYRMRIEDRIYESDCRDHSPRRAA